MQQNQFNDAEYLAQILKNSKEFICECGGKFFKQVLVIRKVSKILTGLPQDSLMPIPVFRCDDCGTPVNELTPEPPAEDIKPKSNLIIE